MLGMRLSITEDILGSSSRFDGLVHGGLKLLLREAMHEFPSSIGRLKGWIVLFGGVNMDL